MTVDGRICVITALAEEARTLAASDARVQVCGMGPQRAALGAAALARSRPRLIVSWGVAGALSAELSCGEILVPHRVCDEHGRRFTAAVHRDEHLLLSVSRPVGSPAARRGWWERSGAVAVDMESAAIAACCARHGVPFMAVRAIADEAGDELADWLVDLIGEDGRPRPWRLLRHLGRVPGELGGMLRQRARFQTAISSLRRAASALLPELTEALA